MRSKVIFSDAIETYHINANVKVQPTVNDSYSDLTHDARGNSEANDVKPLPHSTITATSTVPCDGNDPQLPTATSGSPGTSTQPPTVPSTITVWVIADNHNDSTPLQSYATQHHFCVQHFLSMQDTVRQLPNLLSDMETQPPDLIWLISTLPAQSKSTCMRGQTAARILLKKQLEAGRHVTVEGATEKPLTTGFYVDSNWMSEFPQLQRSKVWWCALALNNMTHENRKVCIYSNTLSTFPLPSRYLSCCGRASKRRGVRPKHTPTSYLLGIVKLIREAFKVTSAAATVASPSFPVTEPVKKKKVKAQGVKTYTEDDGPGEHEANFQPLPQAKHKPLENTFDDCGDDISLSLIHI